jgi:hypothetical protein
MTNDLWNSEGVVIAVIDMKKNKKDGASISEICIISNLCRHF